jgi:uncharacterized membrane protein
MPTGAADDTGDDAAENDAAEDAAAGDTAEGTAEDAAGDAAEGDQRAVTTDTGRVLALSDGVFAIASTLLVLEVRLPKGLTTEAEFTQGLRDLLPDLRSYAVSYLLIAMFWLAHHRLFRLVRRVRPAVIRLNLLLLGVVALLPFSTAMLGDYGREPRAVAIYSANIALIFLVETVIGTQVLRHRDAGAGPGRGTRLTLVVRPAAAAVVFALAIPAALLFGARAGFLLWPFLVLTWFTRALLHPRSRRGPRSPGSSPTR